MCKITGTSYLRVDLWLRRRSRFRRCTQCHPEQWHLMILWFLQTRSVDDKNKMTADIVTWLTYRTLRRLTVSVRGTILACTVTVWPDIPEQMWCWRQSVSTDHPVHSQPPAGSADLQPASTPSAPQCPLQAWKRQKKMCLWEKNRKRTFLRCWTRGYNKLRTYLMKEAQMIQNTDPYMSTACRPRISGRCPWSGAGEGSSSKPFAMPPSGCCLEGTGSDLEEKTGKSSLHFVTYQGRDTLID